MRKYIESGAVEMTAHEVARDHRALFCGMLKGARRELTADPVTFREMRAGGSDRNIVSTKNKNSGAISMYSKYEENIAKLSEKMAAVQGKAKKEGRVLTDDEAGFVAECRAEIHEQRMHLPANSPLTMQNFGERRDYSPHELRGPGQAKDYESLFGTRGGYEWPDKDCNFFQAVFSGRHHPGLTIRASMNETVPSSGGFLVPSQTAAGIHNVALESEIILPRAFVQPMTSNEIKIPAMAIGSHASALMGGFTASYTAESGTINEANPKTRTMTLMAKKLTGMLRFTSELTADIPGGEGQIIEMCGKGLGWYRDTGFFSGTGAGQPLGILNSPCLVTVAKETGQKAFTICYENLTKMMARMYAGSFKNSIWIAHQSCIPQLLTLSLAVGVGGSAIPVMSETNGQFNMLTRPVIFTEKTPALGNKGDILLVDLSQYVVGLRSEIRFDTSIHVAFATDEILARLIARYDGQPLWSEALTLADGATTVSPFVTLADRLV
jgi:HK97 family phage major capsid protein